MPVSNNSMLGHALNDAGMKKKPLNQSVLKGRRHFNNCAGILKNLFFINEKAPARTGQGLFLILAGIKYAVNSITVSDLMNCQNWQSPQDPPPR
jgi:hypothetical protein